MASTTSESADSTDNVILCFFLTEAFSTNHSELPAMKYQAVLEDSVNVQDVLNGVECGILPVPANGYGVTTLDNEE